MIVWHEQYRHDMSLADALDRDARELSRSVWTWWQAALARWEAARLRRAYEPGGRSLAIAAAPELNPDGTDITGRVVDACRFGQFHARRARMLRRAA